MNIIKQQESLTEKRLRFFSKRKLACALILSLSLSACVYVPVVDAPDSTSCKTYTQSMSLNAIEMQGNVLQTNCGTQECAAVALGSVIVVTAGSAIISGSIVLTGNTIHWLEYQGTCSDGYLNKTKQLFLDSIGMGQAKPVEVGNEKQK